MLIKLTFAGRFLFLCLKFIYNQILINCQANKNTPLHITTLTYHLILPVN